MKSDWAVLVGVFLLGLLVMHGLYYIELVNKGCICLEESLEDIAGRFADYQTDSWRNFTGRVLGR